MGTKPNKRNLEDRNDKALTLHAACTFELRISKLINNSLGLSLNSDCLNKLRLAIIYETLSKNTLTNIIGDIDTEIRDHVLELLLETKFSILSYKTIAYICNNLEQSDKDEIITSCDCENIQLNGIRFEKYKLLLKANMNDFRLLLAGNEPNSLIFKNFKNENNLICRFLDFNQNYACKAVSYSKITQNIEYKPSSYTSVSLDEYYIKVLNSKKLNTMQEKALGSILNNDSNVLINLPTNSGKTLLAILAMAKELKKANPCQIFYATPIKALIDEKCAEFKEYFKETLDSNFQDLKITPLSTDHHSLSKHDSSISNIFVGTPEKLDIMSRAQKRFDLIVLDEIHILGSRRGTAIEATVARSQESRIIAMSATIPDIEPLQLFLRVPNKNCIQQESSTSNTTWKCFSATLCRETTDIVAKQVVKFNKQGLIFVNERTLTLEMANGIIKHYSKYAKKNECFGPALDNLTTISISDPELLKLISFRIGIHHAGLCRNDRKTVETLFRKGHIRTIVCTTTLAWGLNLPCDFVVVYGSFNLCEILQMFGRAGRGVSQPRAECWYYGPKIECVETLPSYLLYDLPFHLNSEIYTGSITSLTDAIQWLKRTYLGTIISRTKSFDTILEEYIFGAIHLLEQHNMIKDMCPTFFSKLSFKFYIKLESLMKFRNLNSYYTDELLYELLGDIMEQESDSQNHFPYTLPNTGVDLFSWPTSSSTSLFIQKLISGNITCAKQIVFIKNILRIASALYEYSVHSKYAVAYKLCKLMCFLKSAIYKNEFGSQKKIQTIKTGKKHDTTKLDYISYDIFAFNKITKMTIYFHEPLLENNKVSCETNGKIYIFITDQLDLELLYFGVVNEPKLIIYFPLTSGLINVKIIKEEKTANNGAIEIILDIIRVIQSEEVLENSQEILSFISCTCASPDKADLCVFLTHTCRSNLATVISYYELSYVLWTDNINTKLLKIANVSDACTIILGDIELCFDNPFILAILIRIIKIKEQLQGINFVAWINNPNYKIDSEYFNSLNYNQLGSQRLVNLNFYLYQSLMSKKRFFNFFCSTLDLDTLMKWFDLSAYNGELNKILEAYKDKDKRLDIILRYSINNRSYKAICEVPDGYGKKCLLRLASQLLSWKGVSSPIIDELKEIQHDVLKQLRNTLIGIMKILALDKKLKSVINSVYLLNEIWQILNSEYNSSNVVSVRKNEDLVLSVLADPPSDFVVVIMDERFNNEIIHIERKGQYTLKWASECFIGCEVISKIIKL